jgi:hypothetical protein
MQSQSAINVLADLQPFECCAERSETAHATCTREAPHLSPAYMSPGPGMSTHPQPPALPSPPPPPSPTPYTCSPRSQYRLCCPRSHDWVLTPGSPAPYSSLSCPTHLDDLGQVGL